MTQRNYLKIAGINGESMLKGHEQEIELLDWNWGAENEARPGSGHGAGGGAGRATAHALVFTHRYDRASPQLAKACAQGTSLATATLSARKAGEGQQDFLTIKLGNLHVVDVMVSADGDGIRESITLGYEKIEVAYHPQDAKGGLGSAVGFGWDTRTNQVT